MFWKCQNVLNLTPLNYFGGFYYYMGFYGFHFYPTYKVETLYNNGDAMLISMNQPWWECLHHGNWQMPQVRVFLFHLDMPL